MTKPTDRVSVPLAHPTNHPIVIGLQENVQHRAFDLSIMIGNFKTREDALEYAKIAKEFFERDISAKFNRVQ